MLELRAHFRVRTDQAQNRGLNPFSGSQFSAFCYQHLQRQKHSESTLSPVVSDVCNSICWVTKCFPCFCCMEELIQATSPNPTPRSASVFSRLIPGSQCPRTLTSNTGGISSSYHYFLALGGGALLAKCSWRRAKPCASEPCPTPVSSFKCRLLAPTLDLWGPHFREVASVRMLRDKPACITVTALGEALWGSGVT